MSLCLCPENGKKAGTDIPDVHMETPVHSMLSLVWTLTGSRPVGRGWRRPALSLASSVRLELSDQSYLSHKQLLVWDQDRRQGQRTGTADGFFSGVMWSQD